ncbi:MAG: c-type cytochrome biogenesis protein CcmI, partial [Proteobacteria bacterium]|nr:c-type cytochrome biogenesis protein CcmI [Pseudomonadota bacterium]
MLELALALLATLTVGALLLPFLRGGPEAPVATDAERLEGELGIYRDQLAEIEAERAAGTLPEADAAAARLEIERRVLAAAEGRKPAAAPSTNLHRWVPPAIALLVPLLALGLYLRLGHPGLPSAPFVAGAAMPDGERQIDVARLVADARARVAAQPNDGEAQSALGEALTLEANGTVTPSAVAAFKRALALQPADARALYYLGLYEAQAGDSPAALRLWRELVEKSPPDAPYLPALRAEIARLARASGAPAAPADSAGGSAMPQPTREQQEAMASMTPDQRQQTIRTMVEGLAARLQDNPQDRAGWLRLANAWKVLGENGNAVDAYARADALGPVDARVLADWAESHVRGLKPGEPPPAAAVAVLKRLEQADPKNGLALFYLGAADFAAGDRKAAAQRWKTLLSMLPPDAPIRPLLE